MAEKKLEQVSLYIEGQVFKVYKDILIEHSDYFRAMFSGNYIENEKTEIHIDVVDAFSMSIIVRYMHLGLVDLSEFSQSTIGELASAANFLQITELLKHIEYWLELQLSPSNWVDTMLIAENLSFKTLKERAGIYGLYEFKVMKPKYIQSVHKLVWYLSHKYLNADCELQVFKFGMEWISHKETGADAVLLILGCLDMSRLSIDELAEMKVLIKDYVNSLAEKVIDCLHNLATTFELNLREMKNHKTALREMFTERVYTEALSIMSDSSKRELSFEPCVALWAKEKEQEEVPPVSSNYLYRYNKDQGFTKWLQVADRDLWGWNVVAWGPSKIVILCGEHGRGTGMFWRGLKVYDIVTKEWTEHGVELPVRRHGGVAIVENSLYVIGGVGGYRVLLDTVVVYNLRDQTWREVASFPESIQTPAVCVHEGVVYASGHKTIYSYEDGGQNDRWLPVLSADIRPSCMVSYKGYIYCTQNYFNNFYRFKPGVDTKLELFTCFSSSPSTLCHLGDRLLVFTSTNSSQADTVTVEEFTDRLPGGRTRVLWKKKNCIYTINDVSGSCAIVDYLPPATNEPTDYLKRKLVHYEACHPN